jgi:hypothetical protein
MMMGLMLPSQSMSLSYLDVDLDVTDVERKMWRD